MNRKTAQADNITMKGGGYYSQATKGAKDVIDGATPLILAALSEMDLTRDASPFVMADMGCADGGTSISMVRQVLDTLAIKAPQRPVTLVYTDQPRNDYNALFANLHGLGSIENSLAERDGLSILASATSFYRQILPPRSLDLGFSATAMHWLSAKPGDIADHIHATGASGSDLEAFRAQARRDWETILLQRAHELKPGGHLILVNFGIDEHGRYLGNTGGRHMFDTLNRIWRDFLSAGRIEAGEYRAMTLPQYYNSIAEFIAPLEDRQSAVAKAGLVLESVESRVVACPFATAHAQHANADRFAEELMATIRSWNESIFFAALSNDRPLAERRRLIEDYYQTYAQLVRSDPTGHGMDYVHIYLVIRKT